MTRIIAIVSQKGGVGKTATAQNLGWELAQNRKRTLLVDFDPQSNLTSGFGISLTEPRLTVYNAMQEPDKASRCVEQLDDYLYILPANLDLAGAELQLGNQMFAERNSWLRDGLRTLVDQYDFILIDCPPTLGLLTINALAAADSVIMPIQCELLSLYGLKHLLDTIQLVREEVNDRLQIEGFLLTMYDGRTRLSRDVEENVRETFGSLVFEAVIRRRIKLAEAPAAGQPITVFAPNSDAAADYRQLARELLNRE